MISSDFKFLVKMLIDIAEQSGFDVNEDALSKLIRNFNFLNRWNFLSCTLDKKCKKTIHEII